jgi:PHS family inorganic phosphate transporter-like MFS transporter
MANSEQEKNFTQEPHPHVLENRRHNAVGHILDEGRRAALQRIDNAKFSWVLIQHFYATQSDLFPCSWFHVKVAFVAGVGFFTDA